MHPHSPQQRQGPSTRWRGRARGPRRSPLPSAELEDLFEIECDTGHPALELRLRAEPDSVPVARQALRSLGQTAAVGSDALQDCEIALTEACANAVRHAYAGGTGSFGVRIEVAARAVHIAVHDRGRGMVADAAAVASADALGLEVIEALADELRVHSAAGLGTEVAMTLYVPRTAGAGGEWCEGAVEVVVPRLVAMAAGLTGMSATHVGEAAIVTRTVCRQAAPLAIGGRLRARARRDGGGIELLVGPLPTGQADAILQGSGSPALGRILARLIETGTAVPAATGRAADGEELALRFAAEAEAGRR